MMKNKKALTKRLIAYEIRNILGNPFIPFFGMVFPVFLLFMIAKAATQEVPEAMIPTANTEIFITMSLIIPLAVILLGYGANYSQEIEKEIPLRMRLFGFSEGVILAAKILAELLTLTFGLIFYGVVAALSLDLLMPRFSSFCCLLGCLYLCGVIFMLLAHAVANLLRKFGPTYAVMMVIYFGTMILCGMMGVKTEQLPEFLQKVAALLPMSYISSDFIDFWQGGSYNFGPLIQAFLFFGAVSGLLLFFALRRNRK